MRKCMMPLMAFFAAGMLLVTGCNKPEEKPEGVPAEQPMMVDSIPEATIDTVAVDTTAKEEPKATPATKPAAKPKANQTTSTPPAASGKEPDKVESNANTTTRRPQRDEVKKEEPVKVESESNTTTRRPQRP